jgi:hypothetical protein
MKRRIPFMTLSTLLVLVSPTMAQEYGVAPPKPAASAAMPMDCPMDKAGHGGMGSAQDMSTGMDMKCAMHGKKPAGKASKDKRHDHGKFHKNQ